jgi:RimJ/RimL family protein N-acetyltransferase
MKLIDVYDTLEIAVPSLYQLLVERQPRESISHKEMPTYEQHVAFVMSRPYDHWYAITVAEKMIGAIYADRQEKRGGRRYWGIGILKEHQGTGYSKEAFIEMDRLHPGPWYCNLNPANERSIRMCRALGFFGPIQITLERR